MSFRQPGSAYPCRCISAILCVQIWRPDAAVPEVRNDDQDWHAAPDSIPLTPAVSDTAAPLPSASLRATSVQTMLLCDRSDCVLRILPEIKHLHMTLLRYRRRLWVFAFFCLVETAAAETAKSSMQTTPLAQIDMRG